MSISETNPSPLGSYTLEMTVSQTTLLETTLLDPQDQYIKHIDVQVVKHTDGFGSPPAEVGRAIGDLILGSLAVQEGSSLSEACEEFSGDVEFIRSLIDEYTDGIREDENLLYLEEITLQPADDSPELRTAIFERLIHLIGVPVRFAATSSEALGVPAGSGVLDVEDDRIPEKTIYLPAHDIVIWDRELDGRFTYSEGGFPEEDDD